MIACREPAALCSEDLRNRLRNSSQSYPNKYHYVSGSIPCAASRDHSSISTPLGSYRSSEWLLHVASQFMCKHIFQFRYSFFASFFLLRIFVFSSTSSPHCEAKLTDFGLSKEGWHPLSLDMGHEDEADRKLSTCIVKVNGIPC